VVPRAAIAAALITGALLASCKGKEAPGSKPAHEPPAAPTAQATPGAQAAPTSSVSQAPAPPAPSASSASSASASPPDALDAGVDSGKAAAARDDAGPPLVAEDCKLVRGPAQLSFTGPVSFAFGGGEKGDVRVLFNREGAVDLQAPVFKDPKPRAGVLPKKPESAPKSPFLPEQPPAAQERASWPACAVAGEKVFCMDKEGAVHRRSIAGGGDTIVARGRAGTPLAAAPLGAKHTFLALLANQKTTEGIVTQAFAVLDDGPSILLSEEGSGATFITLVPRGNDVLAVYIDARVALTPLHARTLSVVDGKLKMGRDAVIFMGGGADWRLTGAIAWSGSGPAYALITTTDHDNKFGMAAIPVGDEPKDDTPAVWSYYAKEITPAPVATTVGVSPVRVARVRPVSAEAGSWRVLELGHLDNSGYFIPLCNLVESRSFSDVAIAVSPAGSIWIVYTSADGTWVEQRGRL
jgi:hypothetical protein